MPVFCPLRPDFLWNPSRHIGDSIRQHMATPLPIDKQINRIKAVLAAERFAVIQAPPGAGKTTRVPLALLGQPWLNGKKILLLEPRRLAAVSCAGHMAKSLGENTGETVGYQIRMDKRMGQKTKILAVTQGIFTRMIQGDPALENVGLVIFDEFHERNIHSDLGLALVLESAEAFCPDLRVLVMSATMDTARISALLGHAPVIESRGRTYPVATFYMPQPGQGTGTRLHREYPIESACAAAVKKALSRTEGDMLVFLPGVGEIMRLKRLLEDREIPGTRIVPLYGNLPVKEQRAVFAKAGDGERKVVIATAIAETSITIDGVRTVIDSGLMRTLQYSPRTGMSRLVTQKVSRASADQRRGRAGRTGPGTCYRLWSEYDHSLLKPYAVPEILSSDLASLVLELAAWGVKEPSDLKWLDTPEPGPVGRAKALLKDLDALDQSGALTRHGEEMVNTGLHPRLSHMVLAAKQKNKGALGCRLAALLMERDIVRFDRGESDPDIRLRLEVIEKVPDRAGHLRLYRVNEPAVKRLLASEKKTARDFRIKMEKPDLNDAGELLAHAYPDRIARKRNARGRTYLSASGMGLTFSRPNSLSQSEYIVGVLLDGNPKNAEVWLGAPYEKAVLENDFKHEIEISTSMVWDEKAGEVRQVMRKRFRHLVLEEKIIPVTDGAQAVDLLIAQVKKTGLALLPWSKKTAALRFRACFLKETGFYPDLPDLTDRFLISAMDIWLAPFLAGIYSFSGLASLDMDAVLSALLPWKLRQVVESGAPAHIVVPSGSRKRLDYSDRTGILASPVLRVRLQEMFGLVDTPRVAHGRVPVTVHLLSPANRAVQITQDLKSFWDNTYQEVKKDLMGRYPKHHWPDNPLKAVPTSRVKPR